MAVREGWRGRFFEDFEVGDVYEHPLGRTVTTTDNIWFTLQGANMIGRLNPKNGDLKLVESKTPRSLPYGTVFDSKQQLWVVLFGTNKIAKIDANMNITEYTLPAADARPRRQAIDADDVIWYADFPRGA